MTAYIINQVPDFPFKKQAFDGASLALDWVARLQPDHIVTDIWGRVQKKTKILNAGVAFKDSFEKWDGAFSKKSLELVLGTTSPLKMALTTAKNVDKYVVPFLTPVVANAIKPVSLSASLAASAALVGIRAHGLYENSDVRATGENALLKASARFLSSIYGLAGAIILVVALFVNLPATAFIGHEIRTLIFLTNLFADVYVKF